MNLCFNRLTNNRLLLASFSCVLASIPASAFATNVGPTFYGKAMLTLDHVDNKGAGLITQNKSAATKHDWELNSNASRLGVKGEMDMDIEGLSAIYQAEYEINVDDGVNGDTAFSQRNTFAGLKGQWGQVIAGKFDTAFKASEGKVDQFNDLIPDIDALIGGQNRLANNIQYSSPKLFENYLLTIDFLPAEDTDVDLDGVKDTGVADTISASAQAEWDHWYLALAYDNEQVSRRSVDGIVRGNSIRFVSAYHQDAWEAGFLVQQSTDTTPGSNKKDDSCLLSGAWTLNKTKLKAQVGYSKGNTSEEEGTLSALGVDYALAKKTTMFGYASNLNLDNASIEDNTIGLGMVHSF